MESMRSMAMFNPRVMPPPFNLSSSQNYLRDQIHNSPVSRSVSQEPFYTTGGGSSVSTAFKSHVIDEYSYRPGEKMLDEMGSAFQARAIGETPSSSIKASFPLYSTWNKMETDVAKGGNSSYKSRAGLGYVPPTPVSKDSVSSVSSESSSKLNKLDLSPLVAGSAVAIQQSGSDKAFLARNSGTVLGSISAENISRKADDVSTGIMAGASIGSTLDSFLGPIGTLAGGAIGGAIGAASAPSRQVSTTSGDSSPGAISSEY